MTDRMLRPLGLGDIFDEAFDLYKDNLLFLVLVTAVAMVPLQCLVLLVTLHFTRDFQALIDLTTGGPPDLTQVFSLIGPILHGLAIFAPIYLIGYGVQMTALAAAASHSYLGEPRTMRSVYRTPLRRLVPLFLTALLYGIAVALGFLVCYVGICVPLTLYLFTAHTFVMEEGMATPWRALKRSASLVSGQGGRIFGALCLLWVVYLLVATGIELPLRYALDLLLQFLPNADHIWSGAAVAHPLSARAQVINQVSSGIAALMLIPFVISVLTVLYYDLRVRKEAFDLELLARRLQFTIAPWNTLYTPPARVRRASKTAGGTPV